MRVLVAYASKAGSTKGIAEFIGERLRAHGASSADDLVVRIPDIPSAGAAFHGAAPSLGCVDRLELYFVSLG